MTELMGGTISAVSTLGKGSTFSFTVLFDACPAGGPEGQAQAIAAIDAPARALSGRILLAEDNPVNQMVTQGMLQKLGLRADVAANGAEAVQAFQTLPYDLIFMDVQMPELDGYDATRRIRAIEQKGAATDVPGTSHEPVQRLPIPVIAMTAHAMQGDREACIAAGMNDYLPKPIDAQQLLAALRKWLPAAAQSPSTNEQAVAAELSVSPADPALAMTFDRSKLVASFAGGSEMVEQLLQRIAKSSCNNLAAMEAAFATADLPALHHAAHSLKGSVAYLQIEAFDEIVTPFEQAARQGDWRSVRKHFPVLKAAHAEVLKILHSTAP